MDIVYIWYQDWYVTRLRIDMRIKYESDLETVKYYKLHSTAQETNTVV